MAFRNFKFDVTFSFAEEDHYFVSDVVHHLKPRKLEYYYYKEDEIKTWGKDLRKHLSGIYRRQSRLCVIFVSSDYKEKVWTQFEMKNAQIRAKKNIHEYVLPFKMDSTELPEISPTIKYLSIDNIDSKKLADAIYEKIIDHREKDTFINWLYSGAIRFFSNPRYSIGTGLLALLLIFMVLQDQLTPVNALADRIYKRSKQKIKGSICRDGIFSRSRGPGTCSYHHGVLMKKDSLVPAKTPEEAHEEAKEQSWLPE